MSMTRNLLGVLAAVLLLPATVGRAQSDETPAPPTMSTVLADSSASDWRPLDPANTLYMKLPGGRVVIELAPEFAPSHVANIRALVAERFYDGLAVVRSQDNYVVQWGDPTPEGEERRPIRRAKSALEPEFERELTAELSIARLDDPDPYAPEVGFAHGLPVALDPSRDRVWLAHCYGMLGVGRDVSPGSGSGAELYVVIGHAPRHLDRNVTLVGRVIDGIEQLSTLPRGTGGLGFYEDPAQAVPITSIRMGDEIPPSERARLETLRTDTETFRRLIAARRTRTEGWFAQPTGRIGLCNVPLPVRARPE